MNTTIAVEAYPGRATTETIRKKICTREAPSICADSSSSRGDGKEKRGHGVSAHRGGLPVRARAGGQRRSGGEIFLHYDESLRTPRVGGPLPDIEGFQAAHVGGENDNVKSPPPARLVRQRTEHGLQSRRAAP